MQTFLCWTTIRVDKWRHNVSLLSNKNLQANSTQYIWQVYANFSGPKKRNTRTTQFLLTVLLLSASCNSAQMSSPTTPSHRNPFVHLESLALARPSCLQGNEKVKPRGRVCPLKLWSRTNLPIQSAMWSNSWKDKMCLIIALKTDLDNKRNLN